MSPDFSVSSTGPKHLFQRLLGVSKEDQEERQSADAAALRPLEQRLRRHDSCVNSTQPQEQLVHNKQSKHLISPVVTRTLMSKDFQLLIKINCRFFGHFIRSTSSSS